MSRLLAIVLLVIAVSPAGAISRYSSQQLACNEIRAIITDEGAAIFRYPSPRRNGLTLYDRYVRDESYCASHQVTERVFIPSANADQCPVQRCTSRPDRCLGETCY